MHMLACVEQVTPVDALRILCDEVLECDRKVLELCGKDDELAQLWQTYVQVGAQRSCRMHRRGGSLSSRVPWNSTPILAATGSSS